MMLFNKGAPPKALQPNWTDKSKMYLQLPAQLCSQNNWKQFWNFGKLFPNIYAAHCSSTRKGKDDSYGLLLFARFSTIWLGFNSVYLPSGSIDTEYLETHEVVLADWRQGPQPQGLRLFVRQGSNRSTSCEKELRDYMCDYFNSGDGSVPWQENMIWHTCIFLAELMYVYYL